MKDRDFGRNKGEQNKQHTDKVNDSKGNPMKSAMQAVLFEKQCFQNKNNCCWEKENCHVKPIGRFSERSVVGVEQIESSIENAKNNAKINNINNIKFFAKSAEDWVKQNNTKFDSVVIDPPRAGLSTSVIEHILYLNTNKLIYVSCNPSTLARDLKVITESNKYEVKYVCPVDMFPQTYHIETVVLVTNK